MPTEMLDYNFRSNILRCKWYHNKLKLKYNVDTKILSHTCVHKRQLGGYLANARIYNLIATIQLWADGTTN